MLILWGVSNWWYFTAPVTSRISRITQGVSFLFGNNPIFFLSKLHQLLFMEIYNCKKIWQFFFVNNFFLLLRTISIKIHVNIWALLNYNLSGSSFFLKSKGLADYFSRIVLPQGFIRIILSFTFEWGRVFFQKTTITNV